MSAAEKTGLSFPVSLGILAGGGALPGVLAREAQKLGVAPFIVAFKGHTDAQTVQGFDHVWVSLGATTSALRALRERGISDLVMIGAMRRPSLGDLRADLKTMEFFAKNLFGSFGDDGLLKALKAFLQVEGFQIHGIHKFLPDFLAPKGVVGRCTPSHRVLSDIARGALILNTLSPFDIGQAIVVQDGFVLGIEAAEGTDELIRRCAALRRSGEGGVLIKLSKVQQDPDLDLPTIGPDTIENLARAGFAGVAVQAGASLIVESERTIEIANRLNLFIMGVDGT